MGIGSARKVLFSITLIINYIHKFLLRKKARQVTTTSLYLFTEIDRTLLEFELKPCKENIGYGQFSVENRTLFLPSPVM